VSSTSAPVVGSSATLDTLRRDAGLEGHVLLADAGDDFDLVGAGGRACRRPWCRPSEACAPRCVSSASVLTSAPLAVLDHELHEDAPAARDQALRPRAIAGSAAE
jgi:hypothetical protein